MKEKSISIFACRIYGKHDSGTVHPCVEFSFRFPEKGNHLIFLWETLLVHLLLSLKTALHFSIIANAILLLILAFQLYIMSKMFFFFYYGIDKVLQLITELFKFASVV